jgi:hypothetical protein
LGFSGAVAEPLLAAAARAGRGPVSDVINEIVESSETVTVEDRSHVI